MSQDSAEVAPVVAPVVAQLKYNSVFLIGDRDQNLLAENGYGAKQFNPVPEYMPPAVLAAREAEGLPVVDQNVAQDGPVMLFDEEAYYLFHTGRIHVRTVCGEEVSAKMLWTKFIEKNKGFPLKYQVYAYFRAKHFVVKTGIHFGLDYSVYRTLPTMCHSEMCAMVVDATQPRTVDEVEHGRVANSGQVGWRHLSTLTRVMPDVMKLLCLCYVMPKATTDYADRLDYIFGVDSRHQARVDMSTPAFIDASEVRVVTSLVRRLPVAAETYSTIGDIQAKYRSCSILKNVRQKQTSRKKQKKRRDHTEVREKLKSKHKAHWKALMQPNEGAGNGGEGGGEEAPGCGAQAADTVTVTHADADANANAVANANAEANANAGVQSRKRKATEPVPEASLFSGLWSLFYGNGNGDGDEE